MATQEYLTIEDVSEKDAQRIFSHISIDLATGCWNWTGGTAGKYRNYGSMRRRHKSYVAHRFMYAWLRGPVPGGVSKSIPVLHHVCENTLCCNPDHLELRTQKENILIGKGACANNLRKTHCPRGHPLPVKADTRYGRGRRCQVCLLEQRQDPVQVARKAAYDRECRERIKQR